MEKVKFTAMKDGDAADYHLLDGMERDHAAGTADRLLRALTPFVREQVTWVVEKHGDFQRLYQARHTGGNPRGRDQYRDHVYHDDCALFFERWDQSSFERDYGHLPVELFAPMVRAVFARPARDAGVMQAGVRVPLSDAAMARERVA